jgi:hypothetical protein
MTWHLEKQQLESYARGAIDEVSAYSVEAHLLSCGACREHVSTLVGRPRLERVWAEIEELVDAPTPGPVEALLVRLRVPRHLARLLAATPSLTLSWLAAVGLALAFAVAASYTGERGLLMFLALAPLLPLAGVAAAYAPGLDPTYEIGLAAPLHSFRLLLIRAAAVLTTTILAAAAALALPHLDWRAAAWLLPALGLTVLSLALATFVSPFSASGGLAFGWIALVTSTAAAAEDRFTAFRAPAQLAFLAAILLASLVVVLRREALETRGDL